MTHPRRTRLINSSRVIYRLWLEDQLSRADLASRLGLNKSSISNIVNGLLERGIVQENTMLDSSPKGGRRAIGLTLNKEYFMVIGMEIRSDSYTAIAIDLDGDVLFSETEPKGFTACSFDEEISALIESLCRRLASLRRHLLGVGIGFSGIIDGESQIINRSVSLGFRQPFDFKTEVASRFPFPVFLENDANCGAWGEMVFQKKRELKNFLFILIEFWKQYEALSDQPQPTIGLGFGLNGKIYHGSSGQAGEFKSIFNRDAFSSKQVALPAGTSVMQSETALRDYIQEICENIAFLINTLDIEQVFIGGNIEPFKSFMPQMLRMAIEGNSLEHSAAHCQIQFSSLGYQAVSFGAAALIIDRVLMHIEPFSDDVASQSSRLSHLLSDA